MIKKTEIVEVFLNDTRVGKLALTPDHLCAFEYDFAFLQSFNGIFGVFNDSLPDGWGMLLTDRLLIKKQINPAQFTTLDRWGAMGWGP